MADDVTQLKKKFITNRHRDIASLHAAVAAKQFDAIRTIGNRVKNLAGLYGLDDIGTIGGCIEEAALARDLERATRHRQELRTAVQHAERSDRSNHEPNSQAA